MFADAGDAKTSAGSSSHGGAAGRTTVDLIVHARYVVPIEPEGLVLDKHSVVVDQVNASGSSLSLHQRCRAEQGKIVDILPIADAEKKYSARETVDQREVCGALLIVHADCWR